MEKEQTTIYLKDLVFAALYRWKWIVAGMLCFAILLGGFGLLRSGGTVTLDPVTLTPEQQLKIEQLKNDIAHKTALMENQADYLEKSILMQVDPYAVYTAGRYYYVEPLAQMQDISSVVPAIIKLYSVSHYISCAAQELSVELDVPEWAISELVTVRMDSCLQITVMGRTLEEAQTILDTICRGVEAQQEEISQIAVEHRLTRLSFAKGPVIDRGLYDSQNSAHQMLTNMKNSLTSQKAELNRLLPAQVKNNGSKATLFGVVGAVLGACLVIGLAWVGHIAGGTVYSGRTLKDHTAVRLLGCVSAGRKYDPVTRWLRKLEGRTAYGEIDAVCANVYNRSGDKRKLLLMGNYCDEVIRPLVDALGQKGIDCTVSGDPAQKAQVFEALPGCDAVILVETCGRSRYEHVAWEMETVNDYDKELLGCILIGG